MDPVKLKENKISRKIGGIGITIIEMIAIIPNAKYASELKKFLFTGTAVAMIYFLFILSIEFFF